MSEKSTGTPQALIDLDTIKEEIRKNSVDVVRSIVGEEVRDIVRNSINEAAEADDDMQIIDNEKDSEAEKKEPKKDEKSEKDSKAKSEDKNLLVDGEADNNDSQVPEDETQPTEAPMQEAPAEDEPEEQLPGVQVGENEYDITGEKDSLAAARKVYKLMQDGDDVVIVQDGSDLHLKDNQTGAEYVIDLADDDTAEGNNESDEFSIELDGEKEPTMESKKMRKPMKENRTFVLEADLGYTDEYQDKSPIEGLKAGSPKPYTWSIDSGLPKSDAKPWAGDAKLKGKPFSKDVTKEECEESRIEEGTNTTMPNLRKKTKSHSPAQKANPIVAHQDSKSGEYKAMQEQVNKIKAENLKLKESLVSVENLLNEACVTNKNLGQIVKLFLENTTTRKEKVEIVNRFSNEAKTPEQSKALYESITRELKASKPASTVVESQIAVPKQTINETAIYQSPAVQKMIGLTKRMENLYR